MLTQRHSARSIVPGVNCHAPVFGGGVLVSPVQRPTLVPIGGVLAKSLDVSSWLRRVASSAPLVRQTRLCSLS